MRCLVPDCTQCTTFTPIPRVDPSLAPPPAPAPTPSPPSSPRTPSKISASALLHSIAATVPAVVVVGSSTQSQSPPPGAALLAFTLARTAMLPKLTLLSVPRVLADAVSGTPTAAAAAVYLAAAVPSSVLHTPTIAEGNVAPSTPGSDGSASISAGPLHLSAADIDDTGHALSTSDSSSDSVAAKTKTSKTAATAVAGAGPAALSFFACSRLMLWARRALLLPAPALAPAPARAPLAEHVRPGLSLGDERTGDVETRPHMSESSAGCVE